MPIEPFKQASTAIVAILVKLKPSIFLSQTTKVPFKELPLEDIIFSFEKIEPQYRKILIGNQKTFLVVISLQIQLNFGIEFLCIKITLDLMLYENWQYIL